MRLIASFQASIVLTVTMALINGDHLRGDYLTPNVVSTRTIIGGAVGGPPSAGAFSAAQYSQTVVAPAAFHHVISTRPVVHYGVFHGPSHYNSNNNQNPNVGGGTGNTGGAGASAGHVGAGEHGGPSGHGGSSDHGLGGSNEHGLGASSNVMSNTEHSHYDGHGDHGQGHGENAGGVTQLQNNHGYSQPNANNQQYY